MKRNAMKKMARTALSLLLILSMFSGFGVMRIAGHADYEGEESVEAPAAPVVIETPAAPVVETPAAAEPVAEPVVEAAAEPAAEAVGEVGSETNAIEEVTESSDENAADTVAEADSVVDAAAEEITASEVGNTAESEPVADADNAQNTKRYYEVDFHYEDSKSTLRGDTSNSLDVILGELGLSAAITGVASSNDSLFSCEEIDGVWTVSANQAFDTEESLILTLDDGTTMELLVTDDNAALKYTYYNNENHDIAIEVYENGKMLCIVQNTDAVGEDLAIVQMHDSSGALLSTEQKEELKNLVSSIELGEGVLGVGWTGYNYTENSDKTDVFHGFNKLVEVIPSSTLQVIGWSAFRKCANLVNFDFSKCTNLQTIMQQAFSCTALESADLSSTQVETIGHGAFENCAKLEEVSIPSTVTDIAEQAFYKCNGIQEIEYNAAAYETSTSEKGVENPYLASAIFSASKGNNYSLTIGTDVEVLPRGFFKAIQGAGEISFSAMEDGDDYTVTGRSLAVHELATYNQSPEPFKNLSSDCVVDENGVLYEKKNDALQITYFSPKLTQYTLPKDVRVDSTSIEVGKLGSYANSQVAGTVTYSIAANSEIAGLEISELPEFKISDTVLVLKNGNSNICKPFTAADLTEASYTGTVKNEDGSSTNYLFTLSGWALEDGTVLNLDEAFSLLSDDVSLTSVWTYTAEHIPAEDSSKNAEEPAKAEVPVANLPEAVAPQAVEELNDEEVPMADMQHLDGVEEIAEEATPYAAAPLVATMQAADAASAETAEISVNLFLVVLLVLAIIAVIIYLNKKNSEENA